MRRANIPEAEEFAMLAESLSERGFLSEGDEAWRTLVVTPAGLDEAAKQC